MFHLLEGGVSIQIVWNSLAQEIQFSFSREHELVVACRVDGRKRGRRLKVSLRIILSFFEPPVPLWA